MSFEPVIRELNVIAFGIIATTCFLNPPGGRAVALITRRTYPQLIESIRRWKRKLDYIVVMTHWGKDYEPYPSNSVRRLANDLLQVGANVVYGNHPHVVWPIEQPASDQLVVYSMGNFSQVFRCANRCRYPYLKALYGGVVSVEFDRMRIMPTFYPLMTKHNYETWYRELGIPRSYWTWTAGDVMRWRRT